MLLCWLDAWSSSKPGEEVMLLCWLDAWSSSS